MLSKELVAFVKLKCSHPLLLLNICSYFKLLREGIQIVKRKKERFLNKTIIPTTAVHINQEWFLSWVFVYQTRFSLLHANYEDC